MRFCTSGYVFDNGGLYPRLPSDVDKPVWLLFPEIPVLVLLPMLVEYFSGCIERVNFTLRLKNKIIGKPSLVFILV